MATRTRTAKKTTAKKTTAKPSAKPADPTRPRVDLRHPLPTRTPVGTLTLSEQAACRAAMAAVSIGIPVPVRLWRGPTAVVDGTTITHLYPHTTRPEFTVQARCPHGGPHTATVRTARQWHTVIRRTATCTQQHTQPVDAMDWPTTGIRPADARVTGPVPLQDGLAKARAATAETQPLSTADIAAGLNARRPGWARPDDTDTAKEHPAP
ncbi:hypothetical protein [Streptomyces sp. NPDC008150]|uniref:hypothetical protein n=1 Tax=Streptomyces sp. NPDC008150 TaxID=3364816 RepID=UPI0036EEB450